MRLPFPLPAPALALVLTLALAACAAQPTPPTSSAAPAKAPQCWNGDSGQFMAVGSQARISGVEVSCEHTSDGKNAQWMGKKH